MQPQVKAYTLSTCSHCKRAKELLNQLGIKYTFTDVDLLPTAERNQAIEEVKKINPPCTFPTLIIGDRVVIGANEPEIRKALGLK
jgi:glutaredoxin-like protein NrdH